MQGIKIEDVTRQLPAESLKDAQLRCRRVGDHDRIVTNVKRRVRHPPELITPKPDLLARKKLAGHETHRVFVVAVWPAEFAIAEPDCCERDHFTAPGRIAWRISGVRRP